MPLVYREWHSRCFRIEVAKYSRDLAERSAREGIMNVSVTPPLEKFIDDTMESGIFG